jgi:2-desacetyl-2-hydroxyethyl bacteriochlorophyllide A dehydrogenase
MGELTRAAVLEAPRKLVLVERPKPTPRRGEALIRIAATAICHTDLEIYTGQHPAIRYPVIMGHEATGVVEAVGAGVDATQPGCRVLINPIMTCGGCDCCERGLGNLCRNAGLFGRELDGSLAEHVVVPARNVHPLPRDLTLDAATLIQPLATVRHAQQRAQVAPGDAVAVLGQGATGLLHTQLAKLAGASPVVAISRSAWKLDLARRMQADHIIEAAGQDTVGEVLRVTGGRGADVVIDTVGNPELLDQAIAMLRPGGRLLLYGVSGRAVSDFATFPVYYKEITISGSRGLTAGDVEPSIRLVASGAISVEGLITARYPFDRATTAFEDYERDPGRFLRIVIVQGG